jgi:WD40 repeat protein/tetratricopeptide (TPR) repeat protein
MGVTTATNTLANRERLEAFRRSMRLETAAVAARPELLWQQVSNRLRQREDLAATVLAEDERRVREGASPWFRVLSPLAESPPLLGMLPAYGDVAFVDGSQLVTLGGTVLTVWDGRTGRPNAMVPLGDEAVGDAFSLDALARTAVVSTAGRLQVHDLVSGTCVSRLENSESPSHDSDPLSDALRLELALTGGLRRPFCLSADGALAAGADRTGAVTVWDATTGQVRGALPGVVGSLRACAFTPDGAALVAAIEDGGVLSWRPLQGDDTLTLEGPPPTSPGDAAADSGANLVLDLAVAPDGTFVAAVTGDRVLVWDLPSGRQRWSAQHFGSGRCCAVTPDAAELVTGGARGVLRVWDAATGAITGTLAGHTGTVGRCAVSPSGSLLASTGPDGTRLWALPIGGGSEFFDSHADRVTALAFDPYDDRLASAGADRRVLLWDSTSRTGLGTMDGHEDAVQDCAFVGPDGARMVTAGRDGTVRLWDVATGKEQRRLATGLDPWWGCAVHPDGTETLICGAESVDRVAVSSGSRLASYLRDTETWRGCYAPDGTWAVLTGGAGRVAVWDATTEAITDLGGGHDRLVGVCAASPDGRFAVSGGEDGTVRLWDLPERRERLVLRHDGPVWGCAVTADARYVVSTSWDHTLRIWDVSTGAEVMRLTAPQALHGCAAHPWRTRIAYGDHAGRVHVVEPAGLSSGPVVVTPLEEGGARRVRCPSCGAVRELTQDDLGSEHRCSCGLETVGTDRPLQVRPAEDQEPTTAEGLARALGAQTPREQVLTYSTKACTACGHEFELLRHACPQCGSTAAMPPDVEALQFMQMRQARASELVDRGALLFQSGRLDEAEATFRQAVEANPWNATAHGNLAVVLLRRGRKAEALEGFEKAVSIDPAVPGGREMVERLRAELPPLAPAEPAISADDEVLAARTAMVDQDWDAAIRHFGRAIDVVEQGGSCAAPTFNLYGERATAEAYVGDYRSSLADLDRALAMEPGEWHYLDARARAHYVLGGYEAAVTDWSAALEHVPASGDARAGVLLYRAASYRQLDRPTEALADLRAADEACTDPAIAQGIEDLRRTINSEEGLG